MKNFNLIFLTLSAIVLSACGGGSSSSNDTITETKLECPSGQVATGVIVRLGEIIDKLTLRCADINHGYPDSSADGATSIGGSGGTAKEPFTCPAGSAIKSISGYNGRPSPNNNYLGSLQVTCTDDIPTKSENYATGAGNTLYNFSCAAGQMASGFELNQVVFNGPTVSATYVGFMRGIKCVSVPSPI